MSFIMKMIYSHSFPVHKTYATLYNLSPQIRFVCLSWGDWTDPTGSKVPNAEDTRAQDRGLRVPPVSPCGVGCSRRPMVLRPQQLPDSLVHGMRSFALPQSLSRMCFQQTAERLRIPGAALVSATNNGHFVSNGSAMAGVGTNNLVPIRKQHCLSSFFQHKAHPGENVSKGKVCKTKGRPLESGPAARIPLLPPQSPWLVPTTPEPFSGLRIPLSSPCLPICLPSGPRGQYQDIFTHRGFWWAPRTRNNLHWTPLASHPRCFLLAPHDSASGSPWGPSIPPAPLHPRASHISSSSSAFLQFLPVKSHSQSRPSPSLHKLFSPPSDTLLYLWLLLCSITCRYQGCFPKTHIGSC